MASAEMKILEAEKLHQPMMAAVNMIPIIPLQSKTAVREVKLGSSKTVRHIYWVSLILWIFNKTSHVA